MSLLGNIVFFVFGGFVIFLGYVLGGILLCLTIIGIPFGFMCFRLAGGSSRLLVERFSKLNRQAVRLR